MTKKSFIIAAFAFGLLNSVCFAQGLQPVCSEFAENAPPPTGQQGWAFAVFDPDQLIDTRPRLSDPTDYYLWAKDGDIDDKILAPQTYYGDWTSLSVTGSAVLKYDIQLFVNQGDPLVAPNVRIGGASGTHLAEFQVDPAFWITDPTVLPPDNNEGWHSFSAPISLADAQGNLPSNAFGQWVMMQGNWNDLITNVDRLTFETDTLGGVGPFEEWGWDNICLEPGVCCSDPALLSDLIDTEGTICSGEKTFCEFSYSPIGDMPPATDILVIPIEGGIRFQGTFVDLPGFGASDALIEFKVKAPDCALVSAAQLAANPLAIGEGFFVVTETFLPTEDQTILSVYDFQPAGVTRLLDQADLANPVKVLCVQKDIIAWALTDESLAVMSFIDQTFECTVEPGPGPGQCCGGRPNFEAEEYQAFGGGQIVATTQWRIGDENSPAQGVLNVFDLTNQNSSLEGQAWYPDVYTHLDWHREKMGQVFGVAIDDVGNIYTAHTAIYVQDAIGSIAGPPGTDGGQIYKVDSITGDATVFATLPNNMAINNNDQSYPGLGNICFDCNKQVLYATNFEDGKIYAIDSIGTVISTWDHGTPDNGMPGVVDLGQRVWAVQSHQGRVYYSVWWEDQRATNPTESNEIWSVECDAAGGFMGPARPEISFSSMPFLIAGDWSNPVSDICFSPAGNMMCAERSMETFVNTGLFDTREHKSRALEFVWSGCWVLQTPDKFPVGRGEPGTNSAGGCDYSFLESPNNRFWVTGDALFFIDNSQDPTIDDVRVYGLQGFRASGGNSNPIDLNPIDSLLIDSDLDTAENDKTWIGSLELSCGTGKGESSNSSKPIAKSVLDDGK